MIVCPHIVAIKMGYNYEQFGLRVEIGFMLLVEFKVGLQTRVGDQILIKQRQETKFGRNSYKGPFTVIEAQGVDVVVNKGRVQGIYKIRQVKPYIS